MGCGASKPADAPPGAAPLKAAAAAYKAGSPRAEPSSPAKVAKRLDVKPPDKPAAATAAAKAQELTRSGTAGISDANRLQISAAGRRKTATSRRIAVSAEKNQDGAELSTYLPPVVEKDEADQAKIREGLLTNALFEQLEPPLLQQIVMAVERKEHGAGAVVIQQASAHATASSKPPTSPPPSPPPLALPPPSPPAAHATNSLAASTHRVSTLALSTAALAAGGRGRQLLRGDGGPAGRVHGGAGRRAHPELPALRHLRRARPAVQ